MGACSHDKRFWDSVYLCTKCEAEHSASLYARIADIAELEEENERLVAANKYADTFGYRRAIDDVLALPRKSHVFGHECIRVTDIEALRGGGEQ